MRFFGIADISLALVCFIVTFTARRYVVILVPILRRWLMTLTLVTFDCVVQGEGRATRRLSTRGALLQKRRAVAERRTRAS